MCNFLSVLAWGDGRITCDPALSDHHTPLINALDLQESDVYGTWQRRKWRRAEFLPPYSSTARGVACYTLRLRDFSQLADVSGYELVYDEDTIGFPLPNWWLTQYDHLCERSAKVIKTMIVRDHVATLNGGAWIIPAGVRVNEVTRGTRVVSLAGSIELLDGRVDRAEEGAEIGLLRGRVQGLLPGAQVHECGGMIDNVWEQSRIERLQGTIGRFIDGIPPDFPVTPADNARMTELVHRLPAGFEPRHIAPGDFSLIVDHAINAQRPYSMNFCGPILSGPSQAFKAAYRWSP